MVTGTTASSGAHSIITGWQAAPVSSCASRARYSVWPGSAKPERYRVRFQPVRRALPPKPAASWPLFVLNHRGAAQLLQETLGVRLELFRVHFVFQFLQARCVGFRLFLAAQGEHFYALLS